MGRKDETWKGVGGERIVKLFACFLQGKSAGSAIGSGKMMAINVSICARYFRAPAARLSSLPTPPKASTALQIALKLLLSLSKC